MLPEDSPELGGIPEEHPPPPDYSHHQPTPAAESIGITLGERRDPKPRLGRLGPLGPKCPPHPGLRELQAPAGGRCRPAARVKHPCGRPAIPQTAAHGAA